VGQPGRRNRGRCSAGNPIARRWLSQLDDRTGGPTMRRTAILAAGILLAAAATARAEDAAKPAASAETSTTTVSPDVGTTQSTRPVTDLEAVKAAVNANDRSAKQIPTIAGIGTIKVVRLADIEADATDRQALDS